MKRLAPGLIITAIAGAAVAAVVFARPGPAGSAPVVASAPPAAPSVAAPEDPQPLDATRIAAASWLAAASGETPEFNQVSVEQDLALAAEVFGNGGFTLFAAGPDRPTVQVLRDAPPDDPTIAALADFFAPRGGRDSEYRAPNIDVDAAATAANVAEAIRVAVADRGPALTLYLAGHGHQGAAPNENGVGFWEQSALEVVDFAGLLARSKRDVHVIATTCFSGGLAELAFDHARAGSVASPAMVCGLFAAPSDLEASGCDPNPDRAAQEGFALHFLNALRQLDRDGNPLVADMVDFDGNGEVSLLEAHARVRIASKGIDVPTTTSERWLEVHASHLGGAATDVALPELDAVIEALAEQTDLPTSPTQAGAKLVALEAEIEEASAAAARAADAEDRMFRRAAAELLAQWPVLDDPWHPLFGGTIAEHHDAIAKHLETSQRYAAYLQAHRRATETADAVIDLRVRAAPFERLRRAVDARARARKLATVGGPLWDRFEALLECERSAGPTPSPNAR